MRVIIVALVLLLVGATRADAQTQIMNRQVSAGPEDVSDQGLTLTAPAEGIVGAEADFYELTMVRRLDDNLYRSAENIYIETQYCYHFPAYGDAILKWEGEYGDNKIYWDDDSSCGVENAWRG